LRQNLPFNHDWLYIPSQARDDTPDVDFESVTLPHTNIILPHNGFDDAEYQFISTYRKRFTLPHPLNGRRLFLDFEGAMIATTVTVNGHTFEEFKGGYVPFSFDITDYVREDGENQLTVQVDSTRRDDIPPYGHTIDYLLFGGIYREVSLRYVEPVYITDVFIRPGAVLSGQPRLDVEITVANISRETYNGELGFTIHDSSGQSVDGQPHDQYISLAAGTQETFSFSVEQGLFAVRLWSPDDPALYHLDLWLDGVEKIEDDRYRFGFRQAKFRDDGFYLNGERFQLRGLNRHQMFPYIGGAAPARLQRKDADIVKYELGCNIVRTSHYPQSRHFLDRCDEIGLLVFEEIPGWQHIGDEDWKALALRDVRSMIERDRNRPSIIMWGVRINESFDDHDLYTATNALARELDPTRSTGGVRFWQHSEFLEDVYTFNDFSNSIEEPVQTPHLVTEFAGHMFPTRSYDITQRRVDHALLHAKIQDRARGMGGVSGAIGWCAFDYNTHREFGAGDRICYHGVMDMFRLPKYAAYFYASQIDPSVRPVLHVASSWSFGDHDAGLLTPLIVFSNCEEIEVFMGEVSQGRFQPNRDLFPYLEHPPFSVPQLDAQLAHPYDDLRVVGYLNGEPAAEQRLDSDGQAAALLLEADDDFLQNDGIDMTRLVFKIVDKYGNVLPYLNRVVSFEVDGPGSLIGENPFALIGGQAAVYLKAGQQAGKVTITASTPRLKPVSVTIELTPHPPTPAAVGNTGE
jgi:beta-galactosidase